MSDAAAADTARLREIAEMREAQFAEWNYPCPSSGAKVIREAADTIDALLAEVEALRAARDERDAERAFLADVRKLCSEQEAALTEARDEARTAKDLLYEHARQHAEALEQAQAALRYIAEPRNFRLGDPSAAMLARAALSGSGQTTDTAAETETATDGGTA